MKIQVLVAAMNQQDHSLLDAMNIQSDVIVGNQCSENRIEDFAYKGFRARYLSFAERGVGLNRNNALMRADGDILLFADDDMTYVNGYPEIIENAFSRHPDADILIFNLAEELAEGEPARYKNPRDRRIGWLNYLRYGAARVAVKRKPVQDNGIYFNQCFGGGTEHRHGEDNLFLTACLKNGLRIYAVPETIAVLHAGRKSTWNTGYDEGYLKDQGCLFWAISHRWWRLLCLQDALRRRKLYHMPWMRAYAIMVKKDD